ncbi:hypothetical protein [Rhodopirellula europaea]|uniref:hypothetical protein n=1 Tax=Rhodopirellula europaea TaxID=1263866 RepID=UPI00034B7165|nr:hypothetical protein [Rhodopirellula europaea]
MVSLAIHVKTGNMLRCHAFPSIRLSWTTNLQAPFMKYAIQLNGIQKRLPAGFRLPASFQGFADRCCEAQRGDLGWFAIKTGPTKELLGFDPKDQVVPILRLPDGGFVAFWFCTKRSPALICCDSEGAVDVVGATWADFLTRLSKRKTGIPDLDDRELAKLPSIRGVGRKLTPLTAKRREFKKWIEQHAPEQPDTNDTTAEEIRAELVKLMSRHFDKGRLRPRILLFVTLTSRTYKVDWAAYGIKPYPAPKRLQPVLQRLVTYLGRSLKKSEVSVAPDGCVWVERNICLGDPSFYKR